MNKHKRVMDKILKRPTSATLNFEDFEKLVEYLGGKISEGNGSRKRFNLNDIRMVFHKPHPNKEMCKAAVNDARDYLADAGFDDLDSIEPPSESE